MDISNVRFEQISLPFVPDSGTADPSVKVSGKNVFLGFPSNKGVAKMLFSDCLLCRVGHPNDEGFFIFGFDSRWVNDSIYCKKNFPDLEYDNFYEVFGVDWKKFLLGKGTKIINRKYKSKEGYRHYVFFMKERTFECVAWDYEICTG